MNRSDFISGKNPEVEPDNFKPKMIFGKKDGGYYVTINLKEKLIEGWMCKVMRRHKDAPRPSIEDRRMGRNKPPLVDEIITVREIKEDYHRMMNKPSGEPFDGSVLTDE